jgi:hypothetical protein
MSLESAIEMILVDSKITKINHENYFKIFNYLSNTAKAYTCLFYYLMDNYETIMEKSLDSGIGYIIHLSMIFETLKQFYNVDTDSDIINKNKDLLENFINTIMNK